MDPRSHNFVESCWLDGQIAAMKGYHYDVLMLENGTAYKVHFTREILEDGNVDIRITKVLPSPSDNDKEEILKIVTELQIKPQNGFEAQSMKWTYLGNIDSNTNLPLHLEAEKAKGNVFESLHYNQGYWVYGCMTTKQFYDKGP